MRRLHVWLRRAAMVSVSSVIAATGVACGSDDGTEFVTGTYSVPGGPYMARAGEEGTKCVELNLGNTGPIHVNEIHNVLGTASHHFIVYRKSMGTPNPTPTDCTPFVGTLNPQNGAPLMITQRSDETLT